MSGSTLIISLALSAWFIVAALAGRDGWLVDLPRPLLICISLALAALALLTILRFGPVRRLFHQLPLRLLVGLHATRVIGLTFFVVYARMQMPGLFALPAGAGETLVAAMALCLAALPLDCERWNRYARWWNLLGLAELFTLLIGGLVLALGEPARSMAFARPPISLHLMFITPLALAVHCALPTRLRLLQTPSGHSPAT